MKLDKFDIAMIAIGIAMFVVLFGLWYWALSFEPSNPTIISVCVLFLAASYSIFVVGVILVMLGGGFGK